MWKLKYGHGLKEVNEKFYKFIISNETTGFLFGVSENDDNIVDKNFEAQDAIVYKSDDKGDNWKRTRLGKGRVVDASFVKGSAFAVSNISSEDHYGIIDTSELYVTSDIGESWQKVASFPFYVRNVEFINPLIGYLICKNQKETENFWTVLHTADGGKSWKLLFTENVIKGFKIEEATFFYLSKRDSFEVLIKRNQDGKILHIESFNNDQKIYDFDITENGEIYAAGVKNGNTAIFHLKDKTLKTIQTFSEKQFPLFIHQAENELMLLTSVRLTSSSKFSFRSSTDGGANWIEEKLPIDNYVSPIGFFKDAVWIYSGAGRIQLRAR